MKNSAFEKKSLFSFFTIAYALPIVTTIVVAAVAGRPADIVVKEMSAASLIVLMAMVHAPTIAAMIVVFRIRRFAGIAELFRQIKHWKFAPAWYLKATLIFPATMLAVLFALSFYSSNFSPVLSLSAMAFAALASSLWEEIGWTGFATPLMLNRFNPLQVGLLLGFLHALWHLAASFYGSGVFHGDRFAFNFLATSIGIIGLRVITLWIYANTRSLVLGWLTHASFTGGQLSLVSLDLTASETLVWNSAFSLTVAGIAVVVVLQHRAYMCQRLSA